MPVKIDWEELPIVPDLPETQVHIWRIALEQPGERLVEYSRDLSTDELQRADRFHFERDRRRHLVSHSWLRRLAGGYLGKKPFEIQFKIGNHGKPYLAADQRNNLDFNMAHSGEMALIGFCRGVDLGVDIEQVHAMPDMLKVATRFFSQHEQAQLARIPQDQVENAFFKCWTCKEAFIKNIGDGLYYPLDQFDVDLDPDQPANLLRVATDPDEASRWKLISFPVGEKYAGALAVRGVEDLLVRYLEML